MHNTWYYCLYCGTICTYLVYTAVYACMPVSIDRPVGADDTLMSPKSINNLDGRTTTTWSKIIKTCYYHLYTAVNRQSVSLLSAISSLIFGIVDEPKISAGKRHESPTASRAVLRIFILWIWTWHEVEKSRSTTDHRRIF